MKIEIDLNDILHDDDYGSETLQECVRRQVIGNLTKTIQDGIGRRIDVEVSKVINEEIRKAVEVQMPTIVEDLLSAEYTPVDRWGDRGKGPTTFRKELVKSINEQMVYKKATYDSDKTAFTKAVDAVVEQSVSEFKKEFAKQVDATFVKEAMDYATKKLAERLNIKAV